MDKELYKFPKSFVDCVYKPVCMHYLSGTIEYKWWPDVKVNWNKVLQ